MLVARGATPCLRRTPSAQERVAAAAAKEGRGEGHEEEDGQGGKGNDGGEEQGVKGEDASGDESSNESSKAVAAAAQGVRDLCRDCPANRRRFLEAGTCEAIAVLLAVRGTGVEVDADVWVEGDWRRGRRGRRERV